MRRVQVRCDKNGKPLICPFLRQLGQHLYRGDCCVHCGTYRPSLVN